MSAANRKYQQIKKYEVSRLAREHQEKTKLKTNTFPHCRGTFDTCPSEHDLNSTLESKHAPERCGKCPVFETSGRPFPVQKKEKKMPKEDEDLFKKAFGKG